jgi:hypothetical protein
MTRKSVNLASTRREISRRWSAIVDRSGVNPAALDSLPQVGSIKLLGSGTKTDKPVTADGRPVVIAVVYMAPATEAFTLPGDTRTLCPLATLGCAAECLGHSAGRMVMSTCERARLWKTALFLGDRALWYQLARLECKAFARKCEREGATPAVRADGSTDTGAGRELARMLPGVSFYDYTKLPARALRNARGSDPANYRVTFSYSGENETDVRRVLAAGGNVAAVLGVLPKDQAPLPAALWGAPTVSGDTHDYRPADPRGSVAVLAFKAAKAPRAACARAIASGFALDPAALPVA